MQNLLQYILPFKSPHNFELTDLRERYKDWEKPARQSQIALISALTPALYIIFTLLDKHTWASSDAQDLMFKFHILVITPMMLSICFLAYKKWSYNLVMYSMAIAPIVSSICHGYIASQLTSHSPLITEGYLIIIWIFVVSGVTFNFAIISASICAVILIASAHVYMDSHEEYSMYIFWVFCSYFWGFFGGLVSDRTRKAMFLSLQELELLATTDPLTGLYNRNQFHHVIAKEIDRGLRYEQSFGLIIVDIDHFKQVNDTYGHDIGDEVLKQAAKVLSISVRENDTLVRWGGEEFIVIALNLDQKSLTSLCEKLRNQIETANFVNHIQVTVSLGATLFNQQDSEDSLLLRADKALYSAKRNGRNRTVFSEELIETHSGV